MNIKFYIPVIIFIIMLPIFIVGLSRDKSELPSPLIGKSVPEFTLPSLLDPAELINQSSLKDKFILLNVWATWCVGCREEHDFLVELSKLNILPIIGLNWRDDRDNALTWLNELGNPYALTIEDKAGRTAINLGVYGAPESFLINPEGIIVYKRLGPLTTKIWENRFIPLMGQTR